MSGSPDAESIRSSTARLTSLRTASMRNCPIASVSLLSASALAPPKAGASGGSVGTASA